MLYSRKKTGLTSVSRPCGKEKLKRWKKKTIFMSQFFVNDKVMHRNWISHVPYVCCTLYYGSPIRKITTKPI